MKKYLFKIILLISLWFTFVPSVFWRDIMNTSVIFKNNDTKSLITFTLHTYESKTLLELSLINKLNWKNIWENILNLEIYSVCREQECYFEWLISSNYYWIYSNNKNNLVSQNKENYQELSLDNLSLSQKYELFDYRVLKPILIEIIIFLPLNLVIFHCVWYLLYLIFYKKLNINYFKRIYLNAWLFYILSIIILYYLWYGFTNYNSGLMWLFWYFFFIGIFKFILFLISRYTIERYNRTEKVKSNLGNKILLWYWIIFLLIVGVSFLVKLLSNLF